jgi:hypothetical protein
LIFWEEEIECNLCFVIFSLSSIITCPWEGFKIRIQWKDLLKWDFRNSTMLPMLWLSPFPGKYVTNHPLIRVPLPPLTLIKRLHILPVEYISICKLLFKNSWLFLWTISELWSNVSFLGCVNDRRILKFLLLAKTKGHTGLLNFGYLYFQYRT